VLAYSIVPGRSHPVRSSHRRRGRHGRTLARAHSRTGARSAWPAVCFCMFWSPANMFWRRSVARAISRPRACDICAAAGRALVPSPPAAAMRACRSSRSRVLPPTTPALVPARSIRSHLNYSVRRARRERLCRRM
jgi:hypothetical protein